MNFRKSTLVLVACGLFSVLPAFAQVERVVVEAEGISTACRPGLETALKSMDSVYQYAISVQKQMFTVTYYSGEKFDPKKLRWAADKGEAEVLKLHVSAVGHIEQEGDRQIFVSGEDRFEIASTQDYPKGVKVGIMGVVDDSATPIQLKPDDVKVLDDSEPVKEADPSEAAPAEPGSAQ